MPTFSATASGALVGVTSNGPGTLWIEGTEITPYTARTAGWSPEKAYTHYEELYAENGTYEANAPDHTTVSYRIADGTRWVTVGNQTLTTDASQASGSYTIAAESAPAGRLTFAERTIPETVSEASFSAVVSASVANGSTYSLVVEGDGGSTTVYSLSGAGGPASESSVPVGADLTRYAGETVSFSIVGEGDGGLTVEDFSVTIVEDTDGDGVPDEADLCTTTPGAQSNGCPPSSASVVTLDLPAQAEEFTVTADGAARVETAGSVAFELVTEQGTIPLYERSTPTDGGVQFSVDRTLAERGDPSGGATVERIVLVRSRERVSVTPPLDTGAVTLPRRTDRVTLEVDPPAGTTVRTVRANDRVVLHDPAGLDGRYTVDTSRYATVRLAFEARGPLGRGDARVTYYPAETTKATLEVTVDA